jgi:hypothetical protein
MTREQAADRVAKLQALADPARGGSPAERATAAAKARVLTERFGLHKAQEARPRPARPRPSARERQRGARVRRWFVAATDGAAWSFDASTGEHSPNVRVVSYRDRSNWKIEVEL